MSSRGTRWSPGARRLAALFLVVLMPAAATLVWLGLQLIAQDRQLIAQREEEQRQHVADAIVQSVAQSLAAARAALDRDRPVSGALLARLDGDAIGVQPPGALIWTPTPTALPESDATSFAEAEIAEVRRLGDWGLSAYQARAQARDPRVRAAALLGLARVHRAAGRIDQARDAYLALSLITSVAINGMPADFVARRAVCDLLERGNQTGALRDCAQSLAQDLAAKRWSLDYAAWHLAALQFQQWTGHPLSVSEDARAIASGIDWLWRETRGAASESLPASGQHVVNTEDGVVTVLWTKNGGAVRALVVPPAVVTGWLDAASGAAGVSPSHVALLSEGGAPVVGAAPTDRNRIRRLALDTGLPWDALITPVLPTRYADDLQFRRRLLSAGLAAIVLLLSGGGLLIWRVMQRELAVARLQTDFVAAVSHEFRTPLASLQHVHELLEEDDALAPARRQALYGVIGRSTARLSGLVESLLDFARMEEGRRPYDLQPVDAGELIRRVVDDFRRQLGHSDVVLTITEAAPNPAILADASALTHAVWNLLDNAVKYSADSAPIEVSVTRRSAAVAISVRDRGPGIPRADQRDIFGRFVRGADAVRQGIAGTGLGLAIVSHIVKAHRGAIVLESEPGAGSTFTIELPMIAESVARSPKPEALSL